MLLQIFGLLCHSNLNRHNRQFDCACAPSFWRVQGLSFSISMCIHGYHRLFTEILSAMVPSGLDRLVSGLSIAQRFNNLPILNLVLCVGQRVPLPLYYINYNPINLLISSFSRQPIGYTNASFHHQQTLCYVGKLSMQ